MVWQLTSKPHRVFPRNPLAAVVVDLRFYPILKVAAKVPEFQDRVRSIFADYQEQPQQLVMVQPFGVQVAHEKVFAFKKSDGSATLSLNTTSLTLDSRRHEHRAELISEAMLGVRSLLDVYSPLQATRFGLRYINFVDRETVAKDLERAVSWNDLITARFLSIPSDLADWEGTSYNIEVSSRMAQGELTLRYGLMRDPRDGRDKFRFDSDRYIESPFDVLSIDRFLALFADDAYSVFVDAKGPVLEEWMNKAEGTT
ncbi:MAG TPA: TIGR04255 family protein [Polyangiaceae bacterium]|nr:TIGR04255 family protein [Polyangiaceae bacterium]